MKISRNVAIDEIMIAFRKVMKEQEDPKNNQGERWFVEVKNAKCDTHKEYENGKWVQTCRDPDCKGRYEKKWTREALQTHEAFHLALRQVDNFYDFKKEKKRLERNGETKKLGWYGYGMIRDPFQE